MDALDAQRITQETQNMLALEGAQESIVSAPGPPQQHRVNENAVNNWYQETVLTCLCPSHFPKALSVHGSFRRTACM
jgi:hypothetical protein